MAVGTVCTSLNPLLLPKPPDYKAYNIVLLGGDEFAILIIDHHIGVVQLASYEIKRVELDYFTGEQVYQSLA